MATKKKEPLVQLGVLMTKKNLKDIDAAAKKIGLSRSSYVRHILFNTVFWKTNGRL